jgi:putative ABC transport system ATP-binding protein
MNANDNRVLAFAPSKPGNGAVSAVQSDTATADLELRNLSRRIDDRVLIDDISFQVAKADITALIGPSGAGKSSLLRLINRLDEPTAGTVYLQGSDYRSMAPAMLRRRIGMVMQSAFLFSGTVAANIRFGPLQRNEDFGEAEIGDILSQVGLTGYSERDVTTLSGGEAQRVSLARTLANRPDALLLDEPTSALDEQSTRDVEDLIVRVTNTYKIPCLIVTHNPSQAVRIAQKAVYMMKGKMVAIGQAKEIIDAYRIA